MILRPPGAHVTERMLALKTVAITFVRGHDGLERVCPTPESYAPARANLATERAGTEAAEADVEKQLAQGKKEHAKALHLVADCAKFCDLSADLIANQSPLMAHACAACAEACKECAAECDKFDSAEMKACVKACRECERSCRDMVKAMGGHDHNH